MTEKGINTLKNMRSKIENAYHDRLIKNQRDYPPFALTAWEDRARYHQFIMKLIEECIEEET